jgi:putative phosphoribosyl transferase
MLFDEETTSFGRQTLPMKRFRDRVEAGQELAGLLASFRNREDVAVVGLPRGGVPVAFEVAQYLRVPLDVVIVRKLGAPGEPEFALGAVASGGIAVLNEGARAFFLDDDDLERRLREKREEVAQRERRYRAHREALRLSGRTVILVDDGAATGASMLAAVRAVRALGAREIVAALPVASREAYRALAREADRIVCVELPPSFMAVGSWYEEFPQTSDEEVRDLLERSHTTQGSLDGAS